MTQPTTGQLYIRPYSAHITHNTELFGKMAPFLQLQFQGQIYNSQKSSGSNPVWNEATVFSRVRDSMLRIRLWDYQRFKKHHDLIAERDVNIMNVIQCGKCDSEIELLFEGKAGAYLKIGFQWRTSVGGMVESWKQKQQQAYQKQQGYQYHNPNHLPSLLDGGCPGMQQGQQVQQVPQKSPVNAYQQMQPVNASNQFQYPNDPFQRKFTAEQLDQILKSDKQL